MLKIAAPVKAVFLDLDGTLTDPAEGITSCIRYALRRMGRTAPDGELLTRYIGPPLRESLEELLGYPDSRDTDRALGLYRRRFSRIGLYENRVYPGIGRFLEAAQERRWPLYVVTSKPEIYAKRILKHFSLSGNFRCVFGSGLDGSLVRKEDLIRSVLVRLGLSGREAVMIGDRIHDIEGARANGLFTVGAAYGFGSPEELAGADRICPDPRSLLSVLEAFFCPEPGGIRS